MSVLSTFGCAAALSEPFWGLLLYYTFSVLRPQYMWQWSLPINVRWSLIAALSVMLGLALNFHKIINRIRTNTMSRLLCIYAALTVLSMLAAYDPIKASQWGIEAFKVLTMALIASITVRSLQQIRMLWLMILLVLGYICLGNEFPVSTRRPIRHFPSRLWQPRQ